MLVIILKDISNHVNVYRNIFSHEITKFPGFNGITDFKYTKTVYDVSSIIKTGLADKLLKQLLEISISELLE